MVGYFSFWWHLTFPSRIAHTRAWSREMTCCAIWWWHVSPTKLRFPHEKASPLPEREAVPGWLNIGGCGGPGWTIWYYDWQWHPNGVLLLLVTSGKIPQLPSSAAYERDFLYSCETLISLHSCWPSGSGILQLHFLSLQDCKLYPAALVFFLLLHDANRRTFALATPSTVWKTLFLRS